MKTTDKLGLPLEGCNIDVYWDDRDEVYSGQVKRRKGMKINVNYQDGDNLNHNLNDITWRISRSKNKKWNEPGDATEMMLDEQDSTFELREEERRVKPSKQKKLKRRTKRKLRSTNNETIKKDQSPPFLSLSSLSTTTVTTTSATFSSSSISHPFSNNLSPGVSTVIDYSLPCTPTTPKRKRKLSDAQTTMLLGEEIEVDDEENDHHSETIPTKREQKKRKESSYGSINQDEINILLELSKTSSPNRTTSTSTSTLSSSPSPSPSPSTSTSCQRISVYNLLNPVNR